MADNLKLENYSDREILHIMDDIAKERPGDWVEVEEIATRIGLTRNGRSDEQYALHVKRCVTVRLAWIRKLSGAVERSAEKQELTWRLTDVGTKIVNARLTQGVVDRLNSVDEITTLIAIGALGRRFQGADPHAANLMRREWAYGVHRNRRG